MTKDEVLELAKKAGFYVSDWRRGSDLDVVMPLDGPITDVMIRFAELVAEREREECARVCESIDSAARVYNEGGWGSICAETIRARKA